MKTIGAKELRLHLDEVFDRVVKGEDIIVSHRFKGPIRLTAAQGPSRQVGGRAGLKAFDAAPKRTSPYDPQKSIKELYDESITRKYVR
jgi:antitoxin (DNA-binding transcriptional repressor) of toxin-antitoxin stability system